VHQLRDHLLQRTASVAQAGFSRGGVVWLAGRAENGGLGLEGVHAVESFDERENDVAVMHRIGNRRGKRIAKR
jgi:hypothetical protein